MDRGKPIRILTVRPSLDGHWRGLAVVSAALRDAGMEVIYGGVLNAAEIANAAIQEDVEVIGLSMYGRFGVALKLMQILCEKNFRPLVVVGGTIPPDAIKVLKEAGVDEVFPAGSSLDSIVHYVREKCEKREFMIEDGD